MSDGPPADLWLSTALVRQVIAEQAVARDDLRVLTAIAMRQHNTLAASLTEVRATNSQLDNRVRSLEAQKQ